MKFRHGLLIALLACAAILSGCDRKAPASASPTPTPAASVATPASGADAVTTAPSVSLPKSFDALVDGFDYAVVDPAPTGADDDAPIDVVEAFSYACSHCADFEPRLAAWRARLPADVRFEAVPMPFNPVWTEFARTYYAAVDLGILERTHAALFEAIHAQGFKIESIDALVDWYSKTAGVDGTAFRQAMQSPGTDARIAGAYARAERWGVDSTPTLVVGDRYRIMGFTNAQGGFERTLAVADLLIAELRKARQGAP